jgi:hypothetical protein
MHDAARDKAGEKAREVVDEVWPEDVGERISEPRRT